jgi:hypothetical protein
MNKMLLNIFSKTLKKNQKFKNLHKDESCYLFGNGYSLKCYDLKLFNDKPSIGCNSLFAHKGIKELNLKYYYIGHGFLFYKFWKNQYKKCYEKNELGAFCRKNINNYPDAQYFISLNNYFGIRGDNINYVYHFGQVNKLSGHSEMDAIFTTMGGAMMGMIGVASYMGFTDITLVGCDYTFSPKMHRHFFEKGPSKRTQGAPFNGEVLNFIKNKVTIRTLIPDEEFRGDVLPAITYKELFGEDPVYKENNEIVSEAVLKDLDSMGMEYKIY